MNSVIEVFGTMTMPEGSSMYRTVFYPGGKSKLVVKSLALLGEASIKLVNIDALGEEAVTWNLNNIGMVFPVWEGVLVSGIYGVDLPPCRINFALDVPLATESSLSCGDPIIFLMLG